MNTLFRNEVFAARDELATKPIVVRTGFQTTTVAILALLFILAATAYCLFATYARTYDATGWLVTFGAFSEVHSPLSGTVKRVLVSEGEHVTEGQPLVEIISYATTVNGDDGRAGEFEALKSQEIELLSTLDSLRKLSDKRHVSLGAKLANLRLQREQLAQQSISGEKRVAEINDLLLRMKPALSTGNVSAVQIDQEKSALAAAETGLGGIIRQKLDVEGQLEATSADLDALPDTLRSQLSESNRMLWSVRAQLIEHNLESAIMIRSPRAGVVANLVASDNDSIAAQSRLLSIYPIDNRLIAEVWLPSEAMGVMKVGDAVRLRFDAFPYQRYGSLPATLEELTTAVVMPTEVAAHLGRSVNEPMYRARIAFQRTTIAASDHSFPLLPGMTFHAQIVLERRPLLKWALSPLAGMLDDLKQ